MVKKNGETEILRCSFCNKDQNDVRKLIAGPTVFICDECVEVCNDIIADDNRFENRGVRSSLPRRPRSRSSSTSTSSARNAPRRSSRSPSTTTTSASKSRSSRAAGTTSS